MRNTYTWATKSRTISRNAVFGDELVDSLPARPSMRSAGATLTSPAAAQESTSLFFGLAAVTDHENTHEKRRHSTSSSRPYFAMQPAAVSLELGPYFR